MNIKRFGEFFLSEGLVSTADVRTACEIIDHWMRKNLPLFHKIVLTNNQHGIRIIIDYSGERVTDKELGFVDRMYAMGWYLARGSSDLKAPVEPEPGKPMLTAEEARGALLAGFFDPSELEPGEADECWFDFEPRFQKDKVSGRRFLYHIAEGKHLPRILKQGLVPRSNPKLSFHPDRVYLGELEMMGGFFRIYSRFVEEPALLRVDAKGIELNYDWNVIPQKHAFFTTENIAPSRITVEMEHMTPERLDEYMERHRHESGEKLRQHFKGETKAVR
jgi:hypothetical protein